MPSVQAMKYFIPSTGLAEVRFRALHDQWLASPLMAEALLKVQGKAWQDMDLDERMQFAINKHYTEMAYFLYNHNYAEASGSDKTKADTCRAALEAKLAGMAGKTDALTKFWADVSSGKIALGKSL